jgi:hypothetical protein
MLYLCVLSPLPPRCSLKSGASLSQWAWTLTASAISEYKRWLRIGNVSPCSQSGAFVGLSQIHLCSHQPLQSASLPILSASDPQVPPPPCSA